MKRACMVLTLGLALGLAGCSGGSDDSGSPISTNTAASPTTPAPSPTPSQTPSQTPSPTPTPTPTKATPPPKPLLKGQPMTAKDGRKTSRCLKKRCEVLVSTGDQFRLSTRTGMSTVVIDAVDAAKGVSISLYGDSGFSAPGVTSGPNPRQGSIMTFNGVSFFLVALSGKSLVLRLTR
jgi:hypothetical protein